MTKFNEEQYLENYPDVVEATKRGDFQNGEEHYNYFGKSEGRYFDKKNE